MDITLTLTQEEAAQAFRALTRELNYFHMTGVAAKTEYKQTYDALQAARQKLKASLLEDSTKYPLTEEECLKI